MSTTSFQNTEPNISNIATMVTFQKQDHHFIIARQATLEKEICKIIADGEESKNFIEPDTGLWFGGVLKNKSGRITNHHKDPTHSAYSRHIFLYLNSLPKAHQIYKGHLHTPRESPVFLWLTHIWYPYWWLHYRFFPSCAENLHPSYFLRWHHFQHWTL